MMTTKELKNLPKGTNIRLLKQANNIHATWTYEGKVRPESGYKNITANTCFATTGTCWHNSIQLEQDYSQNGILSKQLYDFPFERNLQWEII